MDFSTTQNIRDQTRAKFDVLMKNALNKGPKTKNKDENVQKSTEYLLSDIESLSSSSEDFNQQNDDKVVKVDVHEQIREPPYMLNKFLQDAAMSDNEGDVITLNLQDPEVTIIKPPVPKPRRNVNKQKLSKSDSNSSVGTYKVSSPKYLNNSDNTKQDSNDAILTNCSTESILTDKTDDKDVTLKESTQSESSKSQSILRGSLKTESNKSEPISKYKDNADDKSLCENETKIKTYLYENIIGITLHKTDLLKLDSLVVHPVVKVHIVDGKTGEYVLKTDKNRSVMFFDENKDLNYIPPIISQAYDFKEMSTFFPMWEETLIINEDFSYILQSDNDTLLFFEIMDFLPFAAVSAELQHMANRFLQLDKLLFSGSSKGWHKIAWAFLKPVGKFGILNVNKKVRLQLYYPKKDLKLINPQQCDLHKWWAEKKLKKYPSSLYVTVKSVTPPEKVIEKFRAKAPMEKEKTSVNFGSNTNDKSNEIDPLVSESKIENFDDVNWSRLRHQTKLPNKCVAKLNSYNEGCMMLKFSNSGLYLACAVRGGESYMVIVYSIKTFEEVCQLPGHQGLIYAITWLNNDKILISASADCMVCIWNFEKAKFLQMLPHPSYVYACDINSHGLIITGCFDKFVRIWDKDCEYNLTQELDGHTGYITSLCFNIKSNMFYSSDSVGLIIEWKHSLENQWYLKRHIILPDLRKTIINQIVLHPKGKRLLVHARDNILRIVDLKAACILQWLRGSLNYRVQMISTFTPCGNFVLSGSENGIVNVWNSNTGEFVTTYTPYDGQSHENLTINCVQFHPHNNIFAVGHYGHDLPILLCSYEDENGNLKMHQHVKKKTTMAINEVNVSDKDSDQIYYKKIDLNIIIKKMDDVITPLLY